MNLVFILAATTILQFAHENVDLLIVDDADPAVVLSRFDAEYHHERGLECRLDHCELESFWREDRRRR